MADQVCTFAEVKIQLKILVGDTTDDVYLSALIDGVTDWMQAHVKRYLVPKPALTFNVDTAAGSVLDVRRYGVRVVTSLGVASVNQPDTGGVYTAVAAADIVLRPPELARDPGMPATQIAILGAYARLADAINGAHLVADCGPAATPDRIKRVGIDAVVAAYQSRKAGGSGVIGAEDAAAVEWSKYFGPDSPQRVTLDRLRGASIGIG